MAWYTSVRAIALAVLASPILAIAQVGMPGNGADPGLRVPFELGGRNSMDLIPLSAGRVLYPLRYAFVKAGSERVIFGSQVLIRNKDYSIDYAAGTIMLMRPGSIGQTVSVYYRYDHKAKQSGMFSGARSQDGLQGMRIEFAPNNAFLLGLGFTERLKDGTVLTSNVYGLSNSFSFGGGSTISGLMMIGERLRSNGTSMMGNYGDGRQQTDEGQGRAIVQNLQMNALGGKITANYQDIDRQFAGFQSFAGGGFDAKAIDAFKRERGLKRNGLSLSDIDFGALSFSSGFRTVGDANGSIDWRSYGLKSGDFSFSWSGQKVDRGFERFADIKGREGDWKQLKKEAGLDRQAMNMALGFGSGELTYRRFTVDDDQGLGGVFDQALSLVSPWANLTYTSQSVGSAFTRFSSLRPGDFKEFGTNPGQLGKERGVSREALSLSSPAFGAPFNFQQSKLGTGEGSLETQSLAVKSGPWEFRHNRLTVDDGFSNMRALTALEQQASLNMIADMLKPGAKPNRKDKNAFLRGLGLNRRLSRLSYTVGDTSLRLDRVAIAGGGGGAVSDGVHFANGKYTLNYRSTGVGIGFDAVRDLTFSEQAVVGVTPGLGKSDFSFAAELDANRSLSFNRMNAEDLTGGASRESLAYKDKGFELAYVRRNVGSDFDAVGTLMDPERNLLRSLMGYDQTSFIAKWQVLSSLNLSLNWTSASNEEDGLSQGFRESKLDWSVDGNTEFSVFRNEANVADPESMTVDQMFNQYRLSRRLGRFGSLTLINEERRYDGEEEEQSNSIKNKLIYKTKLTNNSTLQTVHSETKFDDGSRETSMINTLETEVARGVSVQVSDTKVNRPGEEVDSSKQDYGIKIDLGNDIEVSYAYNRNLKSASDGTKKTNFSMTPGELAGIKVGQLKYLHEGWDGQRDHYVGGVNLANVAPLTIGPMSNVNFYYSADTERDMNRWKRERKTFGFEGSLFGLDIGYAYLSVINPATSERSIDRVMSLSSGVAEGALLSFEFNYDLRTQPDNKNVMIRDFKFTVRPHKDWVLENEIITNPLKQQKNAVLGSIAQDTRVNKWKIGYIGSDSLKSSFVFEEIRNDRTQQLSRDIGVDLTLFANNPSPLKLSYRVSQRDKGQRTTRHLISLQFDQHPGENQTLSLFVGNENWSDGRPSNGPLRNWRLRLDYSLRF
ncbi:MAG: hypothetical protein IH944_02205 [Armatimonadetes bacterium]|nr:hypothetical protein [Armatimonadota bacterium]